jgi:addiction module HigA family antidote
MREYRNQQKRFKLKRPSPGDILLEFYLKPKRMSILTGAKKSKISISHFRKIVDGKTLVTNYTATKLGKAFNTSKRFWLNLQWPGTITNDNEHLQSTRKNRMQLMKGIRQDKGSNKNK